MQQMFPVEGWDLKPAGWGGGVGEVPHNVRGQGQFQVGLVGFLGGQYGVFRERIAHQ